MSRGFKKGTQVLMFDGSIKCVEDVHIGDLIMGDDSTARRVGKLYDGYDTMYKITPNDSTDAYYCTKDVILCMKYNTYPRISPYKSPKDKTKVLGYYVYFSSMLNLTSLSKIERKSKTFSISSFGTQALTKANEELENQLKIFKNMSRRHEVTVFDYMDQTKTFNCKILAYREGVDFMMEYNLKPTDISPYLLGAWLGDGTSANTYITNIDKELIDYLYLEAERMNMILIQGRDTEKGRGSITYRFRNVIKTGAPGSNYFLNCLRQYNLIDNKHIPVEYKITSRQNRLALLAGLIDTDGYKAETQYEITQKNKTLAKDIVFLARSLGFWCHTTECVKGCMYNGEMRKGIYQRMTIGGNHLDEIPVLLPRKKIEKLEKRKQKDPTCYQIKVTKDDPAYYHGFEIDGDQQRFLLADFKVIR